MSDKWFDEIQEVKPPRISGASSGAGIPEASGSIWDALFTDHPEGGGPYTGRDNAVTVLCGFFRAKDFPYDIALDIARDWNLRYCKPPLPDEVLSDKLGRAWLRWEAGTIPDVTPESIQETPTGLEFLRWGDMQRKVVTIGEMDWIVPNVILRGGISFISAPAGGGKSWIAADLVRCCGTGGKWLDALDVPVTNVLYIDEEMGVTGMFYRLDQLEAVPNTLIYTDQQGVRLDNKDHLQQILDLIEREGIELVIIDTFVRVHGKDENDNSAMSHLYRSFKAIKQKGAAILNLHHNRKSGSESGIAHEQMRGAGDIAAQADTVFSISKKDGVYTLVTTKNRHGREEDYVNLSWTIESIEGTTRLCSVLVDVRDQGVSLMDAILDVVSENPGISGNLIAKQVKGNRNRILGTIQEMVTGHILTVMREGSRTVKYYPYGYTMPREEDRFYGEEE
jgi:hypothetical protein